MLTAKQINFFHGNGYLVLENFYSHELIKPIHIAINKIIEIFCRKNNINCQVIPRDLINHENFDNHILDLVIHREEISKLYDAVKQVPTFVNLSSSMRNQKIFEALYPNSCVGYASGGNGIRIDLPHETKFLFDWHQDFPYQLRSSNGLVFWSPLCKITSENGPLEVVIKSHKKGVLPLYYEENDKQTKTYRLRIKNWEQHIEDSKIKKIFLNPGDLLIFDFMTVHKSGYNLGIKPRWSMQFRLFNFIDDFGQKINWSGGYAAKQDIEKIMPELFT